MTLRCIKGSCLISPDAVTEIGGIAVPEFIQRVGRPSGILLQAATEDPMILESLGKRVLVRTAQSFEYEGRKYLLAKIEQILAVVDGDWHVQIVDPIERCQWCKSAGEGNMLMDHTGYCIVCHRNKYGQLQESTPLHPKASPLTDAERERFGGFAEDHLNKRRPKGKIYSFPDQGKRSHAEVPAMIRMGGNRQGRTSELIAHTPKDGKIISAASLKKRSRY